MSTTVSGPLFDGRAEAAMPRIVAEIQDEVAAQASADVHLWMNRFFRHPTPYYETQVVTQRRADSTVITDRGVIYGPWLAGTGSRNAPATRFAGYPHWRLATQQARDAAGRLAAAVVARHRGDLGS